MAQDGARGRCKRGAAAGGPRRSSTGLPRGTLLYRIEVASPGEKPAPACEERAPIVSRLETMTFNMGRVQKGKR
jgi:hypothetical protein